MECRAWRDWRDWLGCALGFTDVKPHAVMHLFNSMAWSKTRRAASAHLWHRVVVGKLVGLRNGRRRTPMGSIP
jgi:hypothetical protein